MIVGIEHALARLARGQPKEAMAAFAWIAAECPTHRRAAPAHYWLALADLRRGDPAAAATRGTALRRCFAGKPTLLDDWLLDASATLLVTNMDQDRAIDMCGGRYTPEFLERANWKIRKDLE